MKIKRLAANVVMALGVRTAIAALAMMPVVFGFATDASASTIYNFYFNSEASCPQANSNCSIYGDVTISGQFKVNGALPSSITDISGTVSGGNAPYIVTGAITGLVSWADSDNVLYSTTGNDYSFGGVSFTVGNTSVSSGYPNYDKYNLYYNGGYPYLVVSNLDPVGYYYNGTPAAVIASDLPSVFTPEAGVSAVPEPATWAMMLLGVGGIGAGLRMARRKNNIVLTAA